MGCVEEPTLLTEQDEVRIMRHSRDSAEARAARYLERLRGAEAVLEAARALAETDDLLAGTTAAMEVVRAIQEYDDAGR
jgi:ornithine cyclodeaminase/alanine dehydrogenase-like protein (mu-crystallin family)